MALTEREYHTLNIDRYSSIKLFLEDRKKYYNKYVLKENFREEQTQATRFGSLVDCLLFSPDDFDDRFVMVTCKKPTGQMGDFVDALWKRLLDCLSEAGIVTRKLDDLMRDAYNDVAFDRSGDKIAFKRKTPEQVIEDFIGGDGADYFSQQRESVHKHLVTQEDIDNAHKVVNGLLNNFVTSEILNRVTDERYTVIEQLPMIFEYRGLKLKSLLDKVVIDHEEKTICPKDLKTTFAVEKFDYNYFKYYYYIQAATYNEALKVWRAENGLDDYSIEPMEFIVTDSINYMNPLIYYMLPEDLMDAYNGFEDAFGGFHRGLDGAIDDLLWHQEKDIWNISRENYLNNGRRRIRKLGVNESEEN